MIKVQIVVLAYVVNTILTRLDNNAHILYVIVGAKNFIGWAPSTKVGKSIWKPLEKPCLQIISSFSLFMSSNAVSSTEVLGRIS